MKAYKLEVLVVDIENMGADAIKAEIERSKFSVPSVMRIQEAEIGDWSDNHPLNHRDEQAAEYARLFGQ